MEQLRANKPGLVELELHCNCVCQLTSDGPKEIAEALKENTTLTSLRLAHYRESAGVSDEAGTAFAEALTVNTTLTKLTLGLSLAGAGTIALAEALTTGNTTLKELQLGLVFQQSVPSTGPHQGSGMKMKIGKDALAFWAHAKKSAAGATAIAEMLRANRSIMTLDLLSTEFDELVQNIPVGRDPTLPFHYPYEDVAEAMGNGLRLRPLTATTVLTVEIPYQHTIRVDSFNLVHEHGVAKHSITRGVALRHAWDRLGLPPCAENWANEKFIFFWQRTGPERALAFASAAHPRLGRNSLWQFDPGLASMVWSFLCAAECASDALMDPANDLADEEDEEDEEDEDDEEDDD